MHREIIKNHYNNNITEFARAHDVHPSGIEIWDIHGPSKMAQLIMKENLRLAKNAERQKRLNREINLKNQG